MRAIVQRVSEAAVSIDGKRVASIGQGLLLLVGIHREDEVANALKLADRVCGMRIFSDPEGKMNLSAKQLEPPAKVLAVSNFTVYGDCFKSRRPSLTASAPFEQGQRLFEVFVEELRKSELEVETGVFGADMQVSLINDGPVTLVIDC